MLVLFLLLARLTDLGSTYWFLSQADFNFAEEANPFSEMLFNLFGFFGGSAVNLFLSMVTLPPLSALLFYMRRGSTHTRISKIEPVAALLSLSLIYFVIAISNFHLPYALYLVLSPHSFVASMYTYLVIFLRFTFIIWIPLAVVFLLYKVGYGKEKVWMG